MADPVTQADLAAAIGPVKGRVELVTQRVDGLEKRHDDHDDRLRKAEDSILQAKTALWLIGLLVSPATVWALMNILGLTK